MIKGVFSLSLRSLDGFSNSIFQLIDVPLCSPSYRCISKRGKTVEVKYRAQSRGSVAHVVIDSIGRKFTVKVSGKNVSMAKRSVVLGARYTLQSIVVLMKLF